MRPHLGFFNLFTKEFHMKLSWLFRGGALAAIAVALVLGSSLSSACAAETKSSNAKSNEATKSVAKSSDAKSVAKVDLNKATAAELEKLPGVGAPTAKKIIAGRPYKSVERPVEVRHLRRHDQEVQLARNGRHRDDQSPSKEMKSPSKAPALVDLNMATQKQLEDLPGVGPTNAKKIIAGRPYKSVDDLSKTKIAASTIAKFKSLVTVDTKKPYSVAKPITSESGSKMVDLNSAKESELEDVQGIGPAYAKKIIAGRPYKSIDDLKKAGVPEATIAKIRSQVTIGGKSDTTSHKGMVWVNLRTKTYHKEGSQWYGKTREGKYMTEADAIKEGYKASRR